MNVLSLFAGIGGLELGLERAGMTVVGQVEIDPYCQRVLAKHWPEVPRHDDVRTAVEWWRGGEPRPTVDLVCGGFPCQPVSLAGQRLAQEDPRWLWPAFHTVVRGLRPRYVLVENVPGLLTAGMGDILGDLASLGYDAEWDRVPAAFVGAPHIRGRIFIVAYPAIGAHVGSITRATIGTVPGSDGEADVADADPIGRDRRPRIYRPGRWGQPTNSNPELAHTTIADGRRPQLQSVATTSRRTAEPGERGSSLRPDHDRWAVEPDVGRVAHGIPHRMDRLRALGNAVVPQVAQHIGRLIMNADQDREGAA